MNVYHVTYHYLATGMEGRAEFRDYGTVHADNEQAAINYVAALQHGTTFGLSAKLISVDLSKINELENMKINVKFNQGQVMNKSNNFSEATQAVSAGLFIVGSVDKDGNFSFAANPVTHATAQLARAEARRLANLNKGKMFVISKLYGAEFTPNAPQPFSI